MSLPFGLLAVSLIWFLGRGTEDESAGLGDHLHAIPLAAVADAGLRIEAGKRSVDVVRVHHSDKGYSAAIAVACRAHNDTAGLVLADLVLTARDADGEPVGRAARREEIRLVAGKSQALKTFTLILDGDDLPTAARLELALVRR